MYPTEHQLRAKIAAECSRRDPDPDRIARLREQHFEAKVTQWIRRQFATAPVLSQDARDRIALEVDQLITCGAVRGGDAHVAS